MRPPEPAEPLEVHLGRLAACLWASGGRIPLTELAAALGISAAAVREQLPRVVPRLGACCLAVITDGVEVRLAPQPAALPALGAMGRLADERRRAALSEEAMAILAYIGWHEEAARRDVEAFRGEDCETLLGRLVTTGLLAVVRDSAGRRAHRYRLTTVALEAMGVASPEELQQKLTPLVGRQAPSPPSPGFQPSADMVLSSVHCQHRCASHHDAAAQLTTLARDLRERRALLGLSEVALSKASGVSRTVINKIEAGATGALRLVPRLAPRGACLPSPRGGAHPPATAPAPRGGAPGCVCAPLLVTQTATLADLASALDLSIPAVSGDLDSVAERRPRSACAPPRRVYVWLWPLPGTPHRRAPHPHRRRGGGRIPRRSSSRP